jgi:hypothetical protein
VAAKVRLRQPLLITFTIIFTPTPSADRQIIHETNCRAKTKMLPWILFAFPSKPDNSFQNHFKEALKPLFSTFFNK